ncbi:MAG: apolipoprotein N-acyltransferase [Polaromonas sp.]|nr:apolipoprotein N-acyltransferase [Polaromonas sp.]
MTSAARPVWPWLWAALAGLAQAASLAWPWGLSPADWTAPAPTWLPAAGQPWPVLQLLAMAVLVHLLRRSCDVRAAAGLGGVFAWAWLAGTFWWLYVSMHTHGGLPAPLAVLAVLALAAFLATYVAGFSALFRLLSLKSIGISAAIFNALAFAACWTLAELARGVLFTGFPWGAVGYAHVDALAWAAPWVGVYGMGALAAFLAALLAGGWAAWRARRRVVRALRGWLLMAVAPLCLAVGPWLNAASPVATRAHGEMPLVLLQGNIAQDDKFDADSGIPQALAWYRQRLAAQPATPQGALVVAPETALPLLPQQLGPDFWQPLLAQLAEGNHAVMLGLPLGNHTQGYANAVWGITPRQAWLAQARLNLGESAERLDQPDNSGQGTPFFRYDKHHLVPFGEFVPPLFRWFVDLMAIPLGDFNRGRLGQAAFEWHGQRIAPNICYEDLFGEELARGFMHAGSAPTVLVNVSNLAWFGSTVALDQHLHISRLRALELGRSMVRATNTGATVVIDHEGRVTHAQPRQTAGALVASVQGRTGLTPFAWWASRWGLWPVWWVTVVVLALTALVRVRRRATDADGTRP